MSLIDIALQPGGDKPGACTVPPDFWTGSAAPECAASGFGDATPQTILQRLAALRRDTTCPN